MEDTDWLATLDYPPVEIGFQLTSANSTASGSQLGVYPRDTFGVNNSITRATVRRFGNAGIVTSQLSNEVGLSEISHGGLVGSDDACLHADNSHTICEDYNTVPFAARKDACVKVWHHNWVHDCEAKCMRGDDYTLNLTMHHNMIFNCGDPLSDGSGQSFGVVLKGDYNKFFHNVVLKAKNGDVVLQTGAEPKLHLKQANIHSVLLNSVAHSWTGKGGPSPKPPTSAHFAAWAGMFDAVVTESMFRNFSAFDFFPQVNSSLIRAGVVHLPEAPPAPDGGAPDAGAYQTGGENWVPGCTFSKRCVAGGG